LCIVREYRTDLTPAQRRLRGQLGAHASWAKTPDRARRTQSARDAFDARFEPEDPDGLLTPEQRAQMAESARKAYMTALAFKSSQARARRRS
jgi:hypothetical protein